MQDFEQDKFVAVAATKDRDRERPGEGAPILFLHGIGELLEFWAPQMAAGIAGHRLVALDLPGHGLSGDGDQPYDIDKFARFVLAFADALSIGRFYGVGNSLGGGVSIRLAGLARDRVAGVVLANPAFVGRGLFVPFRLMTLPWIGELMAKPSPQAIKQQLGAIVRDPSCITPAIRAAIERNTYRPGGGKAFLQTLRATAGLGGQTRSVYMHSQQILRSLQCPVLFIHGKQDVVLPVADCAAAAALTPNAEAVVFDDCGHTPQIEKPGAFNAELQRFVERAPVAQ